MQKTHNFEVSARMRLSDLQKGASKPGDHGLPLDSQPEWLDKDRFRRGQQFIQNNLFPVLLSLHFSLVIGFGVINLLEPLVYTKQSGTPITALKRYLLTFKYVKSWYDGDVWDNKDDPGYKSIRMVRRMHGNVAKSMKTADKVFISQYDMGLVQCGFMAAVFMYPDKFGIKCSKQDLLDFAYYWRGLGYILGISDEYNVCQGNYEEIYGICKEIETKVVLSGMLNPPEMFVTMADAYCNGLNLGAGFALHSRAADIAVGLDGMGVKMPQLGFTDTLRFYLWKFMLFLCRWMPGFMSYMNNESPRKLNRLLDKFVATSSS